MRTSSTDLEVLLGTLQVAETQLRWLMAEALPPAAQYRVDRESTRAAAAAIASIRVDRRIELEPGWAELVEVDDAIDALLERLVRTEVPLDLAASSRVPVREVPPLPADLDGPVAPRAESVAYEAWVPPAAESAPPSVSVSAAASASASAVEAPAYAEPAPAYAAEAYGDGYDDGYDDGYGDEAYGDEAYADGTAYAWEQPADAPAEASTWASGQTLIADEPAAPPAAAPEAALPEPEEEPAPEVVAPAAEAPVIEAAPTREDIGFGGGEFAGADDDARSAVDVYGDRGDRRSVESLGDLGMDGLGGAGSVTPLAPARRGSGAPLSEDDLLDELVERTHAELTLDLPDGAWDEEDDVGEPTQIVERRPARPAAAAVQLNPGGGGFVVGAVDESADEVSESSMSMALELGDAAAWGEEEPSDSIGLAIARVDVDDDDDIISVSVEALTEPTPAPMITAEEVRELIVDAERLAGRDVAQAVLLYSDAIDADPGNVDALLARGRLSMDLGDYTRAASDFLKAEARAPSDAEVQVALGDLFFARKEYGRASAYFDGAIRLDERHARAWFRRGLSRFYRKEFAPAVDDMERAKKIDPLLPSVDTFIDRARRRQL